MGGLWRADGRVGNRNPTTNPTSKNPIPTRETRPLVGLVGFSMPGETKTVAVVCVCAASRGDRAGTRRGAYMVTPVASGATCATHTTLTDSKGRARHEKRHGRKRSDGQRDAIF